ncbi:unnamed protein product [Effrenium voratum]|nr:unnamed protein product [Effrenium voratum]
MDLADWRDVVARDWTRIKDAPAKVRGDHTAGMSAVRQSPEALQYLERHLQLDRQIVLAAIVANQPPQAQAEPEEECPFEVAAYGAMEDLSKLTSMACELGYSTFRFAEVLCTELARSSAALNQTPELGTDTRPQSHPWQRVRRAGR